MKIWKIIRGILLFILFLIIILFLIRLILPKQIDDISPLIECEKELIEKTDVLFVIPKFEGENIADNKEWCNEILSLNKEVQLHGVYHTYEEFSKNRNKEYLQEGIDAFEECFGFKPSKFKPPQIAINKLNKKLVKSQGMELELKFNQFFHKVYHCNDTGMFPNWVVDVF